jgi:peptidoglycan/LPS O-acetylase OafA/YrhL
MYRKVYFVVLKPLTTFRFFAALFVFLSHISFFKEYEFLNWIYVRIFEEGYLGVTFFFVLSGFILTYNYHNKFKTLDQQGIFKFFIARLARIYPVHLLTFFLTVPLLYKAFLENALHTSIKAIPNLLLLQSFVPVNGVYFSYNSVSWSLSNEIFFYICLPFIIFFLNKIRLRGNTLISVVAGVWLVSIFFVFTFRDIELNYWLFYIFPLFRLSDFLVGVFLALLFLNPPIQRKVNHNIMYYTFMEFIAILSLIIAIYYFPYVHQSLRYSVYYIFFISLIIYIFAFQKGLISKLLSNKFFLFLGELSFSFYMLHHLVIRYSSYLLIINSSPIILAVFSFTVSILASALVYTFYEVPLRNKIKKSFYLIFPFKRKN